MLTLQEIKERVAPVARKYELRAVYLFGSYARNDADENSDVDLLIDRDGSRVRSMLDMGGLYEELRDSIGKEIDLVTTQTLEQASTRQRTPSFVETIKAERVKVYE